MVIKTKNFEARSIDPEVPADGSSLQEQMNVFLATLQEKNIIDVTTTSTSAGKLGVTQNHFGTVLYRE